MQSLFLEKVVLTTALWIYFAGGYFGINEWTRTRETSQIGLAWDDKFPFDPNWIVIYALVYWFILLPLPMIQQRAFFRRTALGYLTVITVSFLLFILFPVTYPRPTDVPIEEGFLSWAIGLNYALDAPHNCFPSLHIGMAYLSAFTCWRLSRAVGIPALLISTAIAVSTLLVKQHYLYDIASGLALAYASYWFWLQRPLNGC